jgi:hypothetical protein
MNRVEWLGPSRRMQPCWSAGPDQVIDADQAGGFVHHEHDEPQVTEFGHALARVVPGRPTQPQACYAGGRRGRRRCAPASG